MPVDLPVALCPGRGMAPRLAMRGGNVPASMGNVRALDGTMLQLPDGAGGLAGQRVRRGVAGHAGDVLGAVVPGTGPSARGGGSGCRRGRSAGGSAGAGGCGRSGTDANLKTAY